jgi:hypothetical protein
MKRTHHIVQLASFEGPRMIQGTRTGYDAALDNLVREMPPRATRLPFKRSGRSPCRSP